MSSENIINVSEEDFDIQVLAYSQQMPVVVDFWAEWCGPCKLIGPILEKLAQEAQGSFRLAKVDVDENPNLAIRYAVRSIPSVKAFQDGRIVSEFVGVQPESRIREFLRALAPTRADLAIEKGKSMLEKGQWKSAEATFREILDDVPHHPGALLGLAKSLIPQGYAGEALGILNSFPTSREFRSAEVLKPLAEALSDLDKKGFLDEKNEDDPLAAAFDRSLWLIVRGNIPAAMDGLLDIIRQDKRYREGAPRRVLLGIFEILGEEHALTRQYRNELATVLF